jgi:hypothetical protein
MADRHISLVFTNAAPGRDDAFNEWYGNGHVQECLLNLPGFTTGRRYALNPVQRSGPGEGQPSPWKYLAMYELEGEDVAAMHQATEDFKDAGGFTPHDGSLALGHAAWVYTPLGPRVTREDVHATTPNLGSGEHLFLAFTKPAPGREADLLSWYEVHLPEVVEHFPGIVTGQRYAAHADQRIGMTPLWDYLALYDMRVDDLSEYHRLDAEVRQSGRLAPSNGAFDTDDFAVWIFSPIGELITRAGLQEVAGAASS